MHLHRNPRQGSAELQTVKGIGGSKAKQITSALKLARALNTPKNDTYVIRSPKDAFDLMRYEVGHLMHEEFWIICCNTKNHVISKERISVGSLSAAIVPPKGDIPSSDS
ncbi:MULTISPECIES: JAB domain-containing protein [unclassified Paenibacillus]|uniref:JAB domain-containing protein n=1 Tax=unclassified Paenibacillus TaxID=185978 RepID=UPI00115F8B2F